jgi:hypothetical protein
MTNTVSQAQPTPATEAKPDAPVAPTVKPEEKPAEAPAKS